MANVVKRCKISTSLSLLVALVATFASCFDELTQVTTVPMYHAGYTVLADNILWYRSSRNTLVRDNEEYPLPAELRPHDIKILNATSTAVIHTYNATSVPFYWTDGKQHMEKFDLLSEYAAYSIADMQHLGTQGKNYVMATILHSRSNLYKLLVICLQTKEAVELLTTSRQPSVKIYQKTGVFYFLYTDFVAISNGYLVKYDPFREQTTIVKQWNYSITTMFLVNDAVFYQSGTNQISRYSIVDGRVTTKTIEQSPIAVKAIPSAAQPKQFLISVNGEKTYICISDLNSCKTYNFASFSFSVIPERNLIVYIPRTSNQLKTFNTVTESHDTLIGLLDTGSMTRYSQLEYHAPSNRVLFIGIDYFQKQGIYYEPKNLYLYAYDLSSGMYYKVTDIVRDEWTIFRTPPFYIKEDGSVIVIKSKNGKEHTYNVKFDMSTSAPKPSNTYAPTKPNNSFPEITPIFTVLASVAVVAAMIVLFASVVGFKRSRQDIQEITLDC
jgi:hypothetical protein